MSLLKVSEITDLTGAGSTYAPGHVVQTFSITKTNTFTTTSTSFTDIPELSISITPSSSSSKVLVFGSVGVSNDVGVAGAHARLMRDSTAIDIGDAAASRDRATLSFINSDANSVPSSPFVFLDSPATTSAVTYKMQIRTHGGTVYVNRTKNDLDIANTPRNTSTITVMEIAQ